MQRPLKRKLVLVVAALAVIAFAGGAYAATQSSTPNVRQAFLKDVARRLNVTPARLHSALMGAFNDQLNTAVAKGRLTRAQAAAIRRRAQRTGMVPLGALLGPRPGFAPGGPGLLGLLAPGMVGPRGFFAPRGVGPRGIRGPGAVGPRGRLGLMLGLAWSAAAKGKSDAALKAALLARARRTIDGLVAAKVISPARAKKLLARLPARIDRLVRLIRHGRFRLPFARPPVPPAPAPIPSAPRPVP